MCGIIGYVGKNPALAPLIEGLTQLEYRGYDSAGICLAEPGCLSCTKAVGSLSELRHALEGSVSTARSGIGHTRWATHGKVSLDNAHPLTGCAEPRLAVVLNGIVENHRVLREGLEREGHVFQSQTDAEVVAHLVERHEREGLVEAVQLAREALEGHFAFCVLHAARPGALVATRRHCPLLIGRGEGESFVASTVSAFLQRTNRVQLVEDDEVVVVGADAVEFMSSTRKAIIRAEDVVDWGTDDANMCGFESFMLKEIHEQPRALRETIHALSARRPLPGLSIGDEALRAVTRVVVVACGTAYHAGLVGRHMIESWARVPCEPDLASEWRYRDPIVDQGTLVVGVSQSGETADTLAALRLARRLGAPTIGITNMPGSQITREVDEILLTRCGIEMGVAATKTFTAQTVVMSLLALRLAAARDTLTGSEITSVLRDVRSLPDLVEMFLAGDHPVAEIAERYCEAPFFLYLGRHVGLPACLEGALKLKEVSYIPTEAYAAGELKHGPLALLSDHTPVVCVATHSHVHDKLLSNIEEARTRGAHVIAIATADDEALQYAVDDVIYVPRTHPLLQPVLAVLPLQLLAYQIATRRGLDADRPRNLAKTVTVE